MNKDQLEATYKSPPWMDDIDGHTIAAVCEGGCSSGAYMPAVTYHTARVTMLTYGDDILEYLEQTQGMLPEVPESAATWSGMAVFYLSCAVEQWCYEMESALNDGYPYE